jgi:hypothetical protein
MTISLKTGILSFQELNFVHDKGRYRQHREAARLFDCKCSSGLAIPLWSSSTIQSNRTRKRRFQIMAVSVERAASAQARKRHPKKDPAASAFSAILRVRQVMPFVPVAR